MRFYTIKLTPSKLLSFVVMSRYYGLTASPSSVSVPAIAWGENDEKTGSVSSSLRSRKDCIRSAS